MNEHAVRPGSVAAAAVVIGGIIIAVLPQHASTILRLVIVTAAAAVALYALALHAPPAWWKSPLDRRLRDRRARSHGDEVDAIRLSFRGRRQRVGHDPPLPPQTIRLLQPLIRAALDGADARSDEDPVGGERRLSPHARAILATGPLSHPSWRGTVAPDARTTASAVHRILDELDELTASGRTRSADDTRTVRAT